MNENTTSVAINFLNVSDRSDEITRLSLAVGIEHLQTQELAPGGYARNGSHTVVTFRRDCPALIPLAEGDANFVNFRPVLSRDYGPVLLWKFCDRQFAGDDPRHMGTMAKLIR